MKKLFLVCILGTVIFSGCTGKESTASASRIEKKIAENFLKESESDKKILAQKETETSEEKGAVQEEKAVAAEPAAEAPVAEAPVVEASSSSKGSYETMYVVNCKQSITLRPGPDVNSGEICQIPLGSAVSFVETAGNGFYKIVYDGRTGYSLAAYLSSSAGTVSAPTTEYIVEETVANGNIAGDASYYVAHCKQSITLRTDASVNAAEICQVPLGAQVELISVAGNGFYYINYNGNYGYALASYMERTDGGMPVYAVYKVVNCNESITLRPGAYVESGEICQIPLGSVVSLVRDAGNGFYEIYYMGNRGYSMSQYLTRVTP